MGILMKQIRKSVIEYCVEYVSGLTVQCIYKFPKIIAGTMLSITVVSGISSLIISFITDSIIPIIVFVFIVLLCVLVSNFCNSVISVAVQYIFTIKTDLKKWLAYYEYSFKSQKNDERLLNFQLCSIVVEYYKGEFQNCFDVAGKMKLYQLREPKGKKDRVLGELLLTVILTKASAMLKNEKRFEKSYSSLCDQKGRNETQVVTRTSYLMFCQAIREIYLKRKSTDIIDTWQPEYLSKILLLEKKYFQALNEQLKGNDTRVREIFEELSQENPDLFFVKEAKAYLEANK